MAASYFNSRFLKHFLHLAGTSLSLGYPENLLNLFCGRSSSLQFLAVGGAPELSPKASGRLPSPGAFTCQVIPSSTMASNTINPLPAPKF